MKTKVRLYVEHPLGKEQAVALSREQAHYLFGVMRLSAGAQVTLFNGQHGAWLAKVVDAGKRGGLLQCLSQSQPMQMPPDLWLMFAPIKKTRTDFIVEKAVELGVREILPVQTVFTNSERVRQDRLQAHAVEAAEQCGATFVPKVHDLHRLDRLLTDWDTRRRIMFCDESQAGQSLDLPATPGPWAVVIGPEGGFSDAERVTLKNMHCAFPISLGPRILRADTAAVAALTLWQDRMGDW